MLFKFNQLKNFSSIRVFLEIFLFNKNLAGILNTISFTIIAIKTAKYMLLVAI